MRDRIPRGRFDKCWRFNKADLGAWIDEHKARMARGNQSMPNQEKARSEGAYAYLFLNWFRNTKLRRKDSMILISLGSSGAPLRVAAPYAPTSAM